ncbi:MAG: alpha-amylase family glycosyl hydrolase [Ruminococcus sp.]
MKRIKEILGLILAAAIVVTALSFAPTAVKTACSATVTSVSDDNALDYGLCDQIEGSQILHCWCWSFETITKEIPNIAAAGFTALQTSPINECKVGDDGQLQLMGNGKWYYHYQPTDFKIGNYQLGTLEEFKVMCETAKKYGVKVIVDAVINHVSSDMSVVSDNVKNIEGGAFHSNGYLNDLSKRETLTQQNLLGLHDLNTQNTNVQKYIQDYLVSCVEAGASGFRYDAAIHIELPSDDPAYASDYWPVVLNNGSEFQYGETCQGNVNAVRYSEYAKYMHTYAYNYGIQMRNLLSKNDLNAEKISNYLSEGVEASRLVTVVETHDTYCGEDSWTKLSNEDINLGWAVLVARESTTALYFARPAGSSTTDQWGNNLIGPAGDGNYYSDEITALNRFRNEMRGESEKLSNIGSGTSVLMIERGSKGAVIVNASEEAVEVNTSTVISDGVYTEHISGSSFTVKDSVMTGTVPARSVAVVYNSEFNYPAKTYFSYTGEEIHNGITLTVSTVDANSSYFTVNGLDKTEFTDSATIDLSSFAHGDSVTVTVYAENDAGTASESHTYTKIDTPIYDAETAVYFNNADGEYDKVYAYIYRSVDGESEEEYSWPGIPMKELDDNFYGYVLPDWDEMFIIYNDGKDKQIPENGGAYVLRKGEHKLYFSGSFTDYSSKGEVIANIYRSFDGDEYIYFDPEACGWFYNDSAYPIIKLENSEYSDMEKCITENGETLWRYKPLAGKYSSMTIARKASVGIYNAFTTDFSGDKNLYIADGNWNLGGKWSTFDGKLKDNSTTVPSNTLPDISEPESQPVTEPIVILLGDADENGVVNVKDATAVQKDVAGIKKLTDTGSDNADVNRDNIVNVKDATAIQKKAAGIIKDF